MKTELQKQIATIAPSISISTIWEYDQGSGPISKECEGFDASEDEDWTAWQSEIRAEIIYGGYTLTGSAYLGGIFEKFGDDPAILNPTISGYEPGMIIEALEDIPKMTGSISREIQAAIAFINDL